MIMLLKRITLAATVLLSLCSLEGAPVVRSFNPCKDYASVSAICSHYWKELGESNDACVTSTDRVLYGIAQREPNYHYHTVKVLEENSEIIGFIIYHDLGLMPSMYELVAIAVDPAHQGKGYGTVLLEALKSDLKASGVTAVISRVKKDNQTAIAWHQRQGFFVLGKGKKAQSCFEVVYSYQAEAYDCTAMKLDLQISHDKQRMPRNCISSEVKEETARTLRHIKIRNPSQEIIVARVLDACPLESDISFDHMQLQKIVYRYQQVGLTYDSESVRKKVMHSYARFVLGCQPLTEKDKAYLDRIFAATERYLDDPETEKILKSRGIRVEDLYLELF
jgi:L-amino acid N-acyltransferase YncA